MTVELLSDGLWRVTTVYRQRPGGNKELKVELGMALRYMLLASGDKIEMNEKAIRSASSKQD